MDKGGPAVVNGVFTFRRMTPEESKASHERYVREKKLERRRKTGMKRSGEFTFWYIRQEVQKRFGQRMPPPARTKRSD